MELGNLLDEMADKINSVITPELFERMYKAVDSVTYNEYLIGDKYSVEIVEEKQVCVTSKEKHDKLAQVMFESFGKEKGEYVPEYVTTKVIEFMDTARCVNFKGIRIYMPMIPEWWLKRSKEVSFDKHRFAEKFFAVKVTKDDNTMSYDSLICINTISRFVQSVENFDRLVLLDYLKRAMNTIEYEYQND